MLGLFETEHKNIAAVNGSVSSDLNVSAVKICHQNCKDITVDPKKSPYFSRMMRYRMKHILYFICFIPFHILRRR